MQRGKIEIFKGRNKLFYFRLRASNRKVVAQSEGYSSKRNALKGISAVDDVMYHWPENVEEVKQ